MGFDQKINRKRNLECSFSCRSISRQSWYALHRSWGNELYFTKTQKERANASILGSLRIATPDFLVWRSWGHGGIHKLLLNPITYSGLGYFHSGDSSGELRPVISPRWSPPGISPRWSLWPWKPPTRMKRLVFAKPVACRLTPWSNDYTKPNTNPTRSSRHLTWPGGDHRGNHRGRSPGLNYRGKSPRWKSSGENSPASIGHRRAFSLNGSVTWTGLLLNLPFVL